MISSNIDNNNYVGPFSINPSNCVQLRRIHIDSYLQFKYHMDEKCKKTSSKTKALLRIRPFLSIKTAKSLCNAYILSNFSYYSLIWMRFDKASNLLVNKVHRRALAVVYQNFHYSSNDLLCLSNKVTFHIQFVRKLLSEIFKSLHNQGPSFMSELFQT